MPEALEIYENSRLKNETSNPFDYNFKNEKEIISFCIQYFD